MEARRSENPIAALLKRLDQWPDNVDSGLAQRTLDAGFILALEDLERGQRSQWQLKRLSAVVQHASRSSQAWAARLAEVAKTGRLVDIPVLDRESYRALTGAGPLPAPDGSAVGERTTSGSSGIPVKFYCGSHAVRLNQALYFLEDCRRGLGDGRLHAIIKPSAERHEGEHQVYKPDAATGVGPKLLRSARQFSVEAHARWLSQVKAPLFSTVPQVLDGMLDCYESGAVEPPRLDTVFTFAETVSPELRARTRSILGVEIADRYSCEEAGPIAFQCPNGEEHYHLATANVIVEILRDDGAPCAWGELGRIIISGLNNFNSPVLRYEVGDIGALDPSCPCGYQGPVLSRLLGRKRFLIRLPSGERKYVGTPSSFWRETVPVRERRIVQYEPDRITIEVANDRPLLQEQRQAIIDLMRHEISPEIEFDVVELDRIDWGPTYKRQDVVSLV